MPHAVRLPDGRVLPVQTDDPQEAAAAGRRFLAREAIQKRTGTKGPSTFDEATNRLMSGATFGLTDVEPAALAAGVTGAKNFGLWLAGQEPTYGMGDAYSARRAMDKADADKFTAAHPGASFGLGLLGGLASPGAEQIGNFVTKGSTALAEKAPGFLGGLLTSKAVPAAAVRSAAAAVPTGAVMGVTQADPGWGNAGRGALGGAATSALVAGGLPIATSGGARLVRAGGKATGGFVGSLMRGGLNLAGMPRSDTGGVAIKELANALRNDGATPQQMLEILDTMNKTGGSANSILDVARRLPSGGANTLRLITGAAMSSKGAGVAQQRASEIATALPDEATKLVRGLTPDQRTAPQLAASLEGRQDSLADVMYPGPYGQHVTVTPDIGAELADTHGANAIRQAIDEATARKDYARVARLTELLKGQEAPPPVYQGPDLPGYQAPPPPDPVATAGDLDRVKIALFKRAATQEATEGGVAAGLKERGANLDTALEGVPGMAPARQTYKGIQAQRDALELGQAGLHTPEDEFAPQLQELTGMATPDDNPYPVSADDIRGVAGVGYRQAARNAIAKPAAGGGGVINRIANSPQNIGNQNALYGEDVAGPVRAGLQQELDKVNTIRLVDPTVNSRTAGRLEALADISKPRFHPVGMALDLVNRLRQGTALTDDEKEAIVRAGLGVADPDTGVIHAMHPAVQPFMDGLDALAQQFAPQVGTQAESREQALPPDWPQ